MTSVGRLVFVALVTCYVLGLIVAGAPAPLEAVVYGLTAAVGLEYTLASWSALWERG